MEQQEGIVARVMRGVSVGHTDEGVDEAALRKLLYDFGDALEKVVDEYHTGTWVLFPIFRPFNLVAGYTATDILYVVSPSPGGPPSYAWVDFRGRFKESTTNEKIAKSVIVSKGWERTATFYTFPLNVLNMNHSEREILLERLAEQQFWATLKRILIARSRSLLRDILVAAFFAVVFGLAFISFPQANLWIIAIILGVLVALLFRILRLRS